MDKPIKVLIVDDKEDYCVSLSGAARHNNILLIYALDWETGFELLKNSSDFEFVILDGKGKIEADQETEKDNFVIRAITDILNYNNKKKLHIPICVNTGFMDRFETLEGNVKIFEKNDKDRESMFEYIIEEVKKSEYRTLRAQFPTAFKPFDVGIIDISHKALLLEILKAYNNEDFQKKNINVQRDLLEAIFKSLHVNIPCIPESFFDQLRNYKPDLEKCTQFFEGRNTKDSQNNNHQIGKVIPKDISAAIRKIKESSSRYSHLADEHIVKMPFITNTGLLIELLEWLPIFVDEHYSMYI